MNFSEKIFLHEKLMKAKKVGAYNDQQFSNILENLYKNDYTIPIKEELQKEVKDPIFGREIEVFSDIYYGTEKEYEALKHHNAFANAVNLCDCRFKAQCFHEALIQLVYLPYWEMEYYDANSIVNIVSRNHRLGSLFEIVRMLPVPEFFSDEINAFYKLKLEKKDNYDAEAVLDNLLEQIDKVETVLNIEKKQG